MDWATATLLVAGLWTSSLQAQEAANGAGKNVTLLGINSGTVAPNGTVYGAISGTTDSQLSEAEVDGSVELGFGFGSAEESLGAQLSIVVASLTDDFGDAGYFNFKISRRIAAGTHPTYLGLEASQLAAWGDSETLDPEGTLALTTFGWLELGGAAETFPYMLTIGAGTGLRNNDNDPGVILGAGIGLNEVFGVSAAWTGETVDLGAGVLLKSLGNANFTAILNDAFDQEDSRRITFTVNFAVNNLWGG